MSSIPISSPGSAVESPAGANISSEGMPVSKSIPGAPGSSPGKPGTITSSFTLGIIFFLGAAFAVTAGFDVFLTAGFFLFMVGFLSVYLATLICESLLEATMVLLSPPSSSQLSTILTADIR